MKLCCVHQLYKVEDATVALQMQNVYLCVQKERMKLCSELWAAGIRAEFGYKANPNFKTDIIGVAQDQGIPVVLLFGDAELEAGTVNVKDIASERQETVSRAAVPAAVQKLLAGSA